MKAFTTTKAAGIAAAIFGAGALSPALAAVETGTDWGMPARISADFTEPICTNTGSQISFTGGMTLTGAKVAVIFKNNTKGTKTLTKVGEVVYEVIPAEAGLSVPKQPAFGGVGGNPHISFQVSETGTEAEPYSVPLTERIYLGRCVQDFNGRVERDIRIGTSLSALVGALECTSKGSSLTLQADSESASLTGTLFFDNNYNRVVHERTTAASAQVSLKPSIRLRKGWGVGGAGGNPLIYVQFLDKDGNAVQDLNGRVVPETLIGRCKDLQ
jgi:hypothetical protein